MIVQVCLMLFLSCSKDSEKYTFLEAQISVVNLFLYLLYLSLLIS